MSTLKVNTITNLSNEARFGPVLGTSVAAAGTAIDFTGIPSWAKRVTIMFLNVSTSGTSNILAQVRIASGPETAGYASAAVREAAVGAAVSTAGFILTANIGATSIFQGAVTLTLMSNSNWWVSTGLLGHTDGSGNMNSSSGTRTAAGVLTGVRLTMVNGTDTFDAGSVNVMWE